MKKGFTLIELLAVLLILAFISLIAIPQVLNLIRDSKEKSYLISAQNYVRAVEEALYIENIDEEFNPNECKIKSDGNLLCDTGELKIETGGSRPNNGNIYLKNKTIKRVLNIEYSGTEKYVTKDIDDSEYKLTEEYIPIPNLMDDTLTPVIYDGENWIIVDKTDKWYDYDKQEWANAVILKSGVSNEIGTKLTLPTSSTDIESSDVLAMFVFIPRYEYTIGNTYGVWLEGASEPSESTPGAIDIRFVSETRKNNGSAAYTGSTPNNWYTHPAFTFGSDELSGFWVGKFKATGSSEDPTILPNQKGLYMTNISEYFEIAKKFNNYISGDSHMTKNSEWGAVAYLSQSKYGKYGNEIYTLANKVVYHRPNFYSSFTGESCGVPRQKVYPPKCKYNEVGENREQGTGLCGPGASTTGNITGVYDMNGAAPEYVMGVYDDIIASSGFTEEFFSDPDNKKYYDLYTDTNDNNEAYKGHALGEIKKWNGYYKGFVTSSRPYIVRTGTYEYLPFDGKVSYYFDNYGGNGFQTNITFRVIIS